MAGAGAAVLSCFALFPLLRRQLKDYDAAGAAKDVEGAKKFEDVESDAFQQRIADALKPVELKETDVGAKRFFKRVRNAALSGISTDIHKDVEHDEELMAMHDDAEKFDPRTEQVFKVLQVLSACAMSFAHGANDIANAVGPFAAALYVYENLKVPGSSAEAPVWVMAMGATGLVVGLAT